MVIDTRNDKLTLVVLRWLARHSGHAYVISTPIDIREGSTITNCKFYKRVPLTLRPVANQNSRSFTPSTKALVNSSQWVKNTDNPWLQWSRLDHPRGLDDGSSKLRIIDHYMSSRQLVDLLSCAELFVLSITFFWYITV